MTLILTVRNQEALQEGMAPTFSAESDPVVLGRSRNCDWHLPDPGNVVSSRHCEIRRDGEAWLLKDISTNGTYLNDSAERAADEHRIADGDLIRIGPYEVVATFGEAKTQFVPSAPAAEPEPAAPAPAPAPAAAPEPAPAPVAEATPPAPAEAEPKAEDVPEQVTVMWDSLADINKVDWARGGFGVKDEPTTAAGGSVDEIVNSLIEAAALTETDVARSPETVARAGALMKRLVAGLLVMVEARARAKAQMGAEMTGLQLEGNNPIKFARTPEKARECLPSRTRLHGGRQGVESLSRSAIAPVAPSKRLGALRATLDRFSPGAVRRRAGSFGFLAKLIPAFRDAGLWRMYERDYVAVKKESDEAFMEVFAKEFRKAYERQLRDGLN